ncbi:MAG: methionyl-tRNA formyltransferase [Candidatus Thioglobus sp.]|nr:MAG: methionyl-tRNA formyltransferase [Candidatus Thioglobus sp.]
MRIVFAGTPEFSVVVLTALIDAGHNIEGVYCQPDRHKGRGRELAACPVKKAALEYNLSVFQPQNFQEQKTQQDLINLGAEIMVVVAYGQLLPPKVLAGHRYGCLNIHTSKLPRWRGAAPIQRAILAGDKTTGVSIMQMDSGLDTGDILLEKTCDITSSDTTKSLTDKLSLLAAEAIIKALENIKKLTPAKQSLKNITYAKKLSKDEAWINWHKSAVEIGRQIRAFNPYPIAQTHASSDKFDDKILRILSAEIVQNNANYQPGEIIKSNKKECLVATADGVLSLQTVQLSGKKALDIKDFNNAQNLIRLF